MKQDCWRAHAVYPGKDIQTHTVCCTLWHWPLTPSTSNPNAIDDISLLCFVTKTAGLVWTRGFGGAVDYVQLSQLKAESAQHLR